MLEKTDHSVKEFVNYLIVDIEEEHNIILEDTITLENCIKYDKSI